MRLGRAEKAAIVLLQLGHERATRVLAALDEEEVAEISAEIARMDAVPDGVAEEVLLEFYAEANGGIPPAGRGGPGYAQRLVADSLGADRASQVLSRLSSLLAGDPFDFLQRAEPRQVLSLVQGEHPQIVALVLAHLRPEHASAVMAALEPADRADIAVRIAEMGQPGADAVALVARSLRQRAGVLLDDPEQTTPVGGVQPLVDILNRADPDTEKAILEELGRRDAALAAQVRRLMFTFEDVAHLEDRTVQLVLRQVEAAMLARALKGATPEVTDKLLRNMSERARENLLEEMEVIGAVRLSEVNEARDGVIETIRSLEESGQIVVRRGGEDDYVS